jgi:hypothetical protein
VSYRATIEHDHERLARDAKLAKALTDTNLKLEQDAQRLQREVESLRDAGVCVCVCGCVCV